MIVRDSALLPLASPARGYPTCMLYDVRRGIERSRISDYY